MKVLNHLELELQVCTTQCKCSEVNSGLQQEHQALLTAEPSLQRHD